MSPTSELQECRLSINRLTDQVVQLQRLIAQQPIELLAARKTALLVAAAKGCLYCHAYLNMVAPRSYPTGTVARPPALLENQWVHEVWVNKIMYYQPCSCGFIHELLG